MGVSWLLVLCGCVLLFVCGVSLPVSALTSRPIIGVLTLPCESTIYCQNITSYFPASYVKALESAGGRVVPLDYTQPDDQLRSTLSQLNGALFTGGSASFSNTSQYFHAVQNIYSYTITSNKAGDFFPLWGTCLGFEAIVSAAYGSEAILGDFDADDITLALNLLPAANKSRIFDSSRFGAQVSQVLDILSSEPVTMNNHQRGISPANFTLLSDFVALATNQDKQGVEFVSMLEHASFPIYGTQFHPEKPAFEWDPDEVIQHTLDAVRANGYFMQFFVDESRHCSHHFIPDESSADFIYNYTPDYVDTNFVQVYLFP